MFADRFLKISIGILFVCTCAHAASLSVTVVTVEGEEQNKILEDVSGSGFKFESGTVPFNDLSEVRFSAGTTEVGKTALYLRNGDVLYANILGGDDSKLKLQSGALGEFSLENKWLNAIVVTLKDGPSAQSIDEFLKAPPPKEDQLLLAKGETASGFMEKFSEKELSFNAGGQSRPYPLEKIAVLRLAPLEKYKAAAELRATLILHDGSHISGKLLGLTDKALKAEALDGQTWSVDTAQILSIVFTGGKLVYVSDLKPKEVDEKPYAGGAPLVFKWRRDQSVTGGKLSAGGKEYERGLGVHSFSRLMFELDGEYIKFLCDVGMDRGAAASAVCAWKVVADGKDAASGISKAGSGIESLKLDVKGAKVLELICDYGPDEDDFGDHLDWANARLLKP